MPTSFLTLTLPVTVALCLSACGGHSNHTTPELPVPTKVPVPPKNKVAPAVQFFNRAQFVAGNRTPAKVDRKNTGFNSYQANPNNHISAFNQIRIDGINYPIAKQDKNQLYYNYLGDNTYNAVSSGSFLSYSRFAVLNIKGFAGNAFLAFGQDTLDKDMPHGDATYKGHGLHQAETRGTLIPTDVNATISFSAKTARIDISGEKLALNLAGKISGNKVNGDDGLQAAFYGPEAKELVGSYAKSGNGVFGAVMHTTTE